MLDTLEISMVNDLREIAGVAAQIDEFCTARKYAPEIGYSVNLSIEEILTNRISFGYVDNEPRRIEIILRVEGEDLVVVLVDNSTPFDLSAVAENDIDGQSLEDDPTAGLGLFLVNQVMDGVDYRRESGCNVVTLVKRTRAAPEPDSSGEFIPPDGED